MIIFLYGADTYRSSQKLQQIKDKFLKEVDPSGVNLTALDGAKIKFEEFNQQVKASPFLARKRMIIIKNLISQNKSKEIQKEIVKLLDTESQTPKEDNILIFWEDQAKPSAESKSALWKRLVKEKFAEEFKLLTPLQLNNWAEKEIKIRGGQIEKLATSLLAATVGNDLWHLANEIEKLVNYKKGQTITAKDVEILVKAKFDDNIFNLIDALSTNNKKVALKLLSDQFNLEANEMLLFGMFIRQFRILLLAKELADQNPHLTKDNLARELKLHPYVAQKALYQIKNFSSDKLKNIYQLLLDMDYKIKTSAAKPRVLFDLLIARI